MSGPSPNPLPRGITPHNPRGHLPPGRNTVNHAGVKNRGPPQILAGMNHRGKGEDPSGVKYRPGFGRRVRIPQTRCETPPGVKPLIEFPIPMRTNTGPMPRIRWAPLGWATLEDAGGKQERIRVRLPPPQPRVEMEKWILRHLGLGESTLTALRDAAGPLIAETAEALQLALAKEKEGLTVTRLLLVGCPDDERRIALLLFVRCIAFEQVCQPRRWWPPPHCSLFQPIPMPAQTCIQAMQTPAFEPSLLDALQAVVEDPWSPRYVPPPASTSEAKAGGPRRPRVVKTDRFGSLRAENIADLRLASETALGDMYALMHGVMSEVVSSNDVPILDFMMKIDPEARMSPRCACACRHTSTLLPPIHSTHVSLH